MAVAGRSSGVWRRVDWSVDADVSKKHKFYMFRAEKAMLESGEIYTEFEQEKAERVGGSRGQTLYKSIRFTASPLQT
jgi:hypothetical protein